MDKLHDTLDCIDDLFSNFVVTYEDGTNVFQKELNGFYIDFIPKEEERILVITFEPAMENENYLLNANRPAWGLNFLQQQGFSVLGIKSKQTNWFRDKELHVFFRSKALSNLYECYDKVVFYGGSMGGYASLAFSDTCPGSIIISMAPQSTLDKSIVPWENRFRLGRNQDWSGDFSDGVTGASKAKIVYVCYDPFNKLDRFHVERLDRKNLIILPLQFMGHRIPAALNNMGILKHVVLGAINETLTSLTFKELSRARRKMALYYNEIAGRTKSSVIKSYCIENALMLSSQNVRDRQYCEALHYHLQLCIKNNDKTGGILTTNILETIPQIPRNIPIIINAAKFYILIGCKNKARIFLNSIDPSNVVKGSTNNIKAILAISKDVGSNLNPRLKKLISDS